MAPSSSSRVTIPGPSTLRVDFTLSASPAIKSGRLNLPIMFSMYFLSCGRSSPAIASVNQWPAFVASPIAFTPRSQRYSMKTLQFSAPNLLFIRTLGDAQASGWKPHPATLIQRLQMTGYYSPENIKTETPSLVKALHDISGLASLGSPLRVLHWHVGGGIDELGSILRTPRQFPNLKELVVTFRGMNTNFNFIQTEGLEVLGLCFDLNYTEPEIADKLCYKLAEAIQMLPMSSPLLHTLRLNFEYFSSDYDALPAPGYPDLVAAINTLHLPVLANLEISANFEVEDGYNVDLIPSMDFSPFLSRHPTLLDLTLRMSGTTLTSGISFLPLLRSFKGSCQDSVVICGAQRRLEKLTLVVIHPFTLDERPPLHTVPLPTQLSLTNLHILAVNTLGEVWKDTSGLSSASLAQLVSSFPNLTHLDIYLNNGRIGPNGRRFKASTRPKKHNPELSYNPIDIPPELWALIASFSSRQSVARLCSVSHRFYSTFSELLYVNVVDPPLTAVQSAQLIKTLGDAQTLSWKPHPATLIRKLGLKGVCRGGFRNKPTADENQASLKALRNLYPLALDDLIRGSALRALHWNLEAGIDELGKILAAPGAFPNLKELIVSSKGCNNNFNFVQIRGLEMLDDEYYQIGNKLCYRLAEAMQMLPLSSPLLHTLQMQLIIPESEFHPSPWEGYHDLVHTINLIHLPALAILDISVNQDYSPDGEDDPDQHITDLAPFLTSHPNLLDLTLNVPGTKLPEDDAFLPRLRSFKGSFEDAAVICARRPQLRNLALIFVQRDPYNFPEFRTLLLPTHLSLTKLHVSAVDGAGSIIKTPDELSPASLEQLVSSFVNLTHLDICIEGKITQYRENLILLKKLEHLRIQEYRINCESDGQSHGKTSPFKKKFPPSEYIDEFSLFLPFLPHLARIEVSILADDVEFEFEEHYDSLFSPAAMSGTFCFSVLRASSGAKVVLDSARVRTKRKKRITSAVQRY
ncbi:hypothetical protein DFH09DRAFT_1307484 [Mycena vulgaris]|nr:hypothetical protein DFH09DRAFT_1307484 [Mycena vulgaris]